MNAGILRAVAIIAFVVMIYGGRMVKGKARQTAEGMEFAVKPLFAWVRAIILPLYLMVFVYNVVVMHRSTPWWVAVVFVAIAALGVSQMPGTIVLTADAVLQRFWVRGEKKILYSEVMAIQAVQAGRATRVMGDNRVVITHSSSHSAMEEFRAEMERRTGKKLMA